MIDRDFLAGLRALAEQFSDALEGRASLARDAARAEWERQGEVRFPTGEELAAMDVAAAREADRLGTAGQQQTPTDTPEQIARASIASYREYTERYGQSPDEATEAAIREVLEGLAVDVAAERARLQEALADAERAAALAPPDIADWPF